MLNYIFHKKTCILEVVNHIYFVEFENAVFLSLKSFYTMTIILVYFSFIATLVSLYF